MTDALLILASSSPRRRALLTEAGIRFRVVAPDVEERHQPHETPAAYVSRNAREKADWVCVRGRLDQARAVLAADTVVVLNERILEKPVDSDDAVAMLKHLSGNTHQVMTGVALYRIQDGRVTDRRILVDATTVRFRTLGDDAIAAYVASGEPMDKAGAYAIQGRGGSLVEGVDGSYANVVGLPVERVVAQLDAWPPL